MNIAHLILLVLALAAMLMIAIFLFRHREELVEYLRARIPD